MLPATALCIVGLGARTPVGLRAYPSAAAVRAGISRIREHPFMVGKSGDPFQVAMDGTIADHLRLPRMYALAASALDEALQCLPAAVAARLPVYLGLPELGSQFTDGQAQELCGRLAECRKDRYRVQVEGIPLGNAAGIVALERAIANLGAGPDSCCIVGGVDSMIDADVLEALDEAGRLASPSTRWGFPPGEGAGMLAVCNLAFAQQHRLAILATIAAATSDYEPNSIHTKSICTGVGLAAVLLKAAALAGSSISRQYCDLNGERYREHEFSYAILRVPRTAFINAVDYVAPVDCWGHSGAATVPLLALLPIANHQRGASPGLSPMIWCGSDSGLRGAVVLHLPKRSS